MDMVDINAGQFGINLFVVFVGFILFSGIIESFVEAVLYASKTEEFEGHEKCEIKGYMISIGLAILLAFLADYRFLSFFYIDFRFEVIDWIMSGAALGAGTKFIRKKFDLMSLIPTMANSITVFRKGTETQTQETKPKAKG